MEKQMYPQMPEMAGAPDAPPSYNQSTFPPQPASAPMAPMQPMQPMQPMGQPQQPSFAQPQAMYIQTPALPVLGPRPCLVVCHSCHEQKMSKIRYETGTKTHIFAAILCVFGLFCCACIPYCVDTCKNLNHYCGNCDAYLGMYK